MAPVRVKDFGKKNVDPPPVSKASPMPASKTGPPPASSVKPAIIAVSAPPVEEPFAAPEEPGAAPAYEPDLDARLEAPELEMDPLREVGPSERRDSHGGGMSNTKIILTWLPLCLVAAGCTVAGVKVLNQQFGLQQKVAAFGKVH
jgi:hypothetical protein